MSDFENVIIYKKKNSNIFQLITKVVTNMTRKIVKPQ
jgi:hypothetical protein